MNVFDSVLLVGHTLQMWALLLCVAIFVLVTIRVLVLGSAHYERIARVPLDDSGLLADSDGAECSRDDRRIS